MSIELTNEEQRELEYFRAIYDHDTEAGLGFADSWGFRTNAPDVARGLVEKGFLATNPNTPNQFYITRAGGLLVGLETIISPFDADELTAARAEIARLTAENAALKDALKTADTGWSEAISMIENMVQENYTVPKWVTSKDPWATAKEYKRRKDDIRKLYRGE